MLAHLRLPGASLSVIPEGIAGIFLAADPSTETIFLSRRKGFVKLAVQGGAGQALPPRSPNPRTGRRIFEGQITPSQTSSAGRHVLQPVQWQGTCCSHCESVGIGIMERGSDVALCNTPGADLLPVYHMGQSQLLTFWGTEEVSRRWRASIGVFWGAYGLPLPRRHPIISLIGSPIPGAQQAPFPFSRRRLQT